MNTPLNRGSAIDQKRFVKWLSHFTHYHTPVTRDLIESWLSQFSSRDRDMAARLLDAVLFITHVSMNASFRSFLESIGGWNIDKSKRKGRWFFVPFSGSAGESGDSMVHLFRQATSMTNKQYHELFIYRSDLVSKNPGPEDTVVLIDDFSGTGSQACTFWKELYEELLPNSPRIILLLVAATNSALSRISAETGMEPYCERTLTKSDNIFDSACKHFTSQEKITLLRYCKLADNKRPQGYGDAGLLVVLAHRCPNNTIPILHATHARWHGLFPRYD